MIIQCITPTCILFLLSLCEPLLVPNSIEHVRMRTSWFYCREIWNILYLTCYRSIMMYDKLLACTYFQKGLYITYNFFDFEQLHTALFVPDIQQCYTDLQQHRFQIKFPGKSPNFLFFFPFYWYLKNFKEIETISSQLKCCICNVA